MFDTTPHLITAVFAAGMALAFFVADRRSPTSRTVALFLASVAVAIAVAVRVEAPLYRVAGASVPWWGGIFAIPEVLAFVFAYEWILRVRRTVPARNLYTEGPDRLLRIAQLLAVLYGLLALAFPEKRWLHFTGSVGDGIVNSGWFYVFTTPLVVSLLLGSFSALLMLNRRPDRAEAIRAVAFVVAAPFLASGMVLQHHLAPVGMAIGLVIFLVGATQYHVIQGQRAHFLSKFLAPQVAELVRERGLKSATDEKTLEVSVVCCDLRGFTAFTSATSSGRVIRILREYYDAIGAAAAEFGGTIKDQAGDGVLILVGAPIPFDDCAERALALAKRARDAGIAVTQRWSDADLRLGVGVGVASGFVTVGVIGHASRLEYTAVGPAVNLASRLCAEAGHGQVFLDQRTIELLASDPGRGEVRPGEALRLKGFQQPVQSYTIAAAVGS